MLNDLNLRQLKAAEFFDKPLIINAGPGTGKTKTLISKVEYLIREDIFKPSEIAVLTFTEKASKELKQRLNFVDTNSLGFVGTFHALALKFLQRGNNINIVTNNFRREIVQKVLDSKYKGLSIKEAELLITNYKNGNANSEYIELIKAYNKQLKANNYVDFDDLLVNFLNLQNLPFLKYILVDEFQDTNLIQYEILKKLITPPNLPLVRGGTLCVIGDPLQAIYGFRGARSDIFEKFKTDFPDFKEIILVLNYRSTEGIIETSHKLFPKSPDLKAIQKEKGEVKVYSTTNEYTEADLVIREISESVGGTDLNQASNHVHVDKGLNFSEFAIVYRAHGFTRVVKQKLRESGIPFQLVGEESMYETKEFDFLYRVMSFMNSNSKDDIVEILRTGMVALHENIINRLFVKWEGDPLERIKLAIEQKELHSKTTTKLRTLLVNLEDLIFQKDDLKFSESVKGVVKNFNLKERFKSAEKLTDFNDIINETLRFDKFDKEAFKRYTKYLTDLRINEGYDPEAQKASLLTIHASKGLEFKYVFVLGLEEGSIPNQKAVEEGNVEEEKRLLYVAMTRAKTFLTFTSANFRNKQKQKKSRFLEIIANSTYLKVKEDEFAKKLEIRKEKIRQKKAQIGMF